MYILKGNSALSEFRQKQVLKTVQELVKSVQSIHAQFVHLVDINGKLSLKEKTVLETLLSYGQEWGNADDSAENTFVVLPRFGTISPWSSKATDIVKNIGMDRVCLLYTSDAADE